MDHTGVTPAVALSAPDLAHIVQRPGPFLTVYLTTEVSVENAAQRAEVRWKTVRTGLAGQGVDERILALVDPLVADAHLQGECLVAIATPGGLAHVAHEPDPPRRDVARWGPLPIVGPLLEWRQSQVPHIVALVDRKGGDLFVFPTTHPDEHVEIEGGDDPIHRSKPGGWSQKRYQRRAEHTWEANAEEVAAALTELVDEEQPRLVAVGGDVRAVQLLKEALPERVAELVQDVRGTRSSDGSVDAAVDDVTRAVATAGKLLCVNGGADRSTLATSIWNYNHSWEYVVRVLDVPAQLETAKGGD